MEIVHKCVLSQPTLYPPKLPYKCTSNMGSILLKYNFPMGVVNYNIMFGLSNLEHVVIAATLVITLPKSVLSVCYLHLYHYVYGVMIDFSCPDPGLECLYSSVDPLLTCL